MFETDFGFRLAAVSSLSKKASTTSTSIYGWIPEQNLGGEGKRQNPSTQPIFFAVTARRHKHAPNTSDTRYLRQHHIIIEVKINHQHQNTVGLQRDLMSILCVRKVSCCIFTLSFLLSLCACISKTSWTCEDCWHLCYTCSRLHSTETTSKAGRREDSTLIGWKTSLLKTHKGIRLEPWVQSLSTFCCWNFQSLCILQHPVLHDALWCNAQSALLPLWCKVLTCAWLEQRRCDQRKCTKAPSQPDQMTLCHILPPISISFPFCSVIRPATCNILRLESASEFAAWQFFPCI